MKYLFYFIFWGGVIYFAYLCFTGQILVSSNPPYLAWNKPEQIPIIKTILSIPTPTLQPTPTVAAIKCEDLKKFITSTCGE